jgi:hypothetical protein
MTVAILVAVAGVAASVPLIPTGRELAFIRFKDQLYDSARAELERRLADGDLSVAVVRPLAELHLQYADVDSAILLLERFVAEHPDDLAARRMLGTYYQFGQRPYDYLRNLEQMAARSPTPARLRELAEIYSWMDEPEKQIATLALLDARGHATPDDLVALARLRAARGRYDEAVSALERAEAISSRALDEDGLELLAALLIDAGRPEVALRTMIRRHAVVANPGLSVRIARTFHGKGHPGLAASLLEATPALDERNPGALAALTQAEVDAGLAARALSRLIDLNGRGVLPATLRGTLVELAVVEGDLDTAWAAGRALGWSAVPPAALAGIVAAAQAKGRTAEVQELLREAGDACLATMPVLAAQLAVDRGDPAAARRWIAAAGAAPSANPDDQVALAGLEQRLGMADAGYTRLKRHLAAGHATTWAVESFAQLALETGRSREAAELLHRARGRVGLPGDVAWARVATDAGESRAVIAWLRSPPARRAPAQALRDIAYLSLDAHRPAVAVEASRLLAGGAVTKADRLLLARALSENGDTQAALDVLRPLAARDATAAAMFDAALARASRTSAKARDELVRRAAAELASGTVPPARRGELARVLAGAGAFAAALDAMAPLVRADRDAWLATYVETAKRVPPPTGAVTLLASELRRADLDVAARESLVRALLDLGATRVAEPYLRELAAREGGSWPWAYDEALAARGDRAARLDWWRGQGLRADLPPAERRAAAFKLIDLRDKAGAEQVLRALVEGHPSESASLAQLLYLWGPRPPRAALDWIEARARAAAGSEQAVWLQHLVEAGAARRALALLTPPPVPADTARFDVWVTALRAARNRDGLQRAIEDGAAATRDPQRLDALARVALAESLPAAAERAFGALVTVDPDALEARRWLGLLALARNDAVAAREHLEFYVAAGGRDPEALLRHGELLEGDHRPDEARRAFALGLEASERADRRTIAARRTHAFLLAHAGRTADAQRDLEDLVATQPADAHLRADYAAWLLKEGRHADAARILDLR